MTSIRGAPVGDAYRRPTKRYEPGRICEKDDCQTRLSVYNSEPNCNLHKRRKKPRLRGTTYDDAQQEPLVQCVPCARVMSHLGRNRVMTSVTAGGLEEFAFNDKVHISGVEGAGTLCEVL